MPRQSIAKLKKAIEAAPEISTPHRKQMLELVDSLATEVDTGVAEESSEKLREAIAVAEGVVRQRSEEDSPEDHQMGERLSDLEEKVELVALEHPVIANVLSAIARLI